jgi:G6PDH family F420-dependent oxidoreductase
MEGTTMAAIGYFLSCEEQPPDALIEQAKLAQQAGFTHLAISDHFHPWTDAQGSSPFVWSVIGALSQAVDLPITTFVTCPTVRIHPAVVAQAAATAAVMTNGRFRLGVGTGEALNEHVTGERWPAFPARAEMLKEAVEVIRALMTGENVDHRGRHYTVENARLYTVPEAPVPIHVSGFGPNAAELAAEIGDGYVTMAPDTDLIEQFQKAGGAGKPVLGGIKVCYGRDRDAALTTAHRLWASDALPGELAQILPTPAHFEQANSLVTPEQVASRITCGDVSAEHVAAVRKYLDVGFDEVYVSQIGPDYREFFDFYRQDVLPALTGDVAQDRK